MKGRSTGVVFVAVCRMWPLCPSPATQMLPGAHNFSPKSLGWVGEGAFPSFGGCSGVWGSPRPGSVAGHGAELEGFGAACEAEREGEGKRCWGLEGELLQQGHEEDEELGPGELLPGTSPLAWKRSTNNPTESRRSCSHLRASSGPRRLAQAAAAFLPGKVRWQCSPTQSAQTFPRSLLPSKLRLFREAKSGNSLNNPVMQLVQEEKALFFLSCSNKLISFPLRAATINCDWDFHCGDGLEAGQEQYPLLYKQCLGEKNKSFAKRKATFPSIILPAEKGRKASRLLYWPFSRKCSGLKVSGVSHTFLSNIIEVRLVIRVVPCERWRKGAITQRRGADVLSDRVIISSVNYTVLRAK